MVTIFRPNSVGSVFRVLQPDYLSRLPQWSDNNEVSAVEMSVWDGSTDTHTHLWEPSLFFCCELETSWKLLPLVLLSGDQAGFLQQIFFNHSPERQRETLQTSEALCHKSGLQKRTDVNQSSRWPKENSQCSATVNAHFIPFIFLNNKVC